MNWLCSDKHRGGKKITLSRRQFAGLIACIMFLFGVLELHQWLAFRGINKTLAYLSEEAYENRTATEQNASEISDLHTRLTEIDDKLTDIEDGVSSIEDEVEAKSADSIGGYRR